MDTKSAIWWLSRANLASVDLGVPCKCHPMPFNSFMAAPATNFDRKMQNYVFLKFDRKALQVIFKKTWSLLFSDGDKKISYLAIKSLTVGNIRYSSMP